MTKEYRFLSCNPFIEVYSETITRRVDGDKMNIRKGKISLPTIISIYTQNEEGKREDELSIKEQKIYL